MVSVMLYPCILCVALLMDLFVLCVWWGGLIMLVRDNITFTTTDIHSTINTHNICIRISRIIDFLDLNLQ